MKTLFSPEIMDFIKTHEPDPVARRMYALGSVTVKVSGMYGLMGMDDPPPEACETARLLLEGLESGDPETYARHNIEAMEHYHRWQVRIAKEAN